MHVLDSDYSRGGKQSIKSIINNYEVLAQVNQELAVKLEIPIIDCSSLMPHDTENFADFVHYTNQGATRMAQIANDAINEFVVQKMHE